MFYKLLTILSCSLAFSQIALAQNAVQSGNPVGDSLSTSGIVSGGGDATTTGTLGAAQTANSATDNANGKQKVTTSTDGGMADGSTTGTLNGGDSGSASK